MPYIKLKMIFEVRLFGIDIRLLETIIAVFRNEVKEEAKCISICRLEMKAV